MKKLKPILISALAFIISSPFTTLALAQNGGSGQKHSAISTPSPEAKKAASEVLVKGGNAVDAAVAALLTLTVEQTYNVSIAGYGGSIVIYSAKDKKVSTIDFDSRAPLNFKPETYDNKTKTHGFLAAGVPGIVSGLALALKNHGTLSWKEVSHHAYELADKGLIVDKVLSDALNEFVKFSDTESVKTYLPNGVPAIGSVWVQKDLAKVIKQIGDKGSDIFYKGEIAKKIVKHFQDHGSALTYEDYNKFQAEEVEPIKINYRGVDIYSPPVPSAGITSLGILKTLENFDLTKVRPFGFEYFNIFAQTSKLAWGERFKYIGDPEFVKFSATDLLLDKASKERAEKVRHDLVVAVEPGNPEPQHTVNVVVIDKSQNIVSLTATQGGNYGSGVVVPGTGLVFGHGMSRFDDLKTPNAPQGGKRPQHNMAPVVVLKDNKPYIGLGLPGGRYIVTVTPQLLIDVLDFNLTPEQAIKAPRIHNEGDNNIKITKGISDIDVKDLELKGFKVEQVTELGGPANIAIIDLKTGKIDAASQAGSTGVEIK